MLGVVISLESLWKQKCNSNTKDHKLKCVFSHFFPPFFVDMLVIKLNDENGRTQILGTKVQQLQKKEMLGKSGKKQALVS